MKVVSPGVPGVPGDGRLALDALEPGTGSASDRLAEGVTPETGNTNDEAFRGLGLGRGLRLQQRRVSLVRRIGPRAGPLPALRGWKSRRFGLARCSLARW